MRSSPGGHRGQLLELADKLSLDGYFDLLAVPETGLGGGGVEHSGLVAPAAEQVGRRAKIQAANLKI